MYTAFPYVNQRQYNDIYIKYNDIYRYTVFVLMHSNNRMQTSPIDYGRGIWGGRKLGSITL